MNYANDLKILMESFMVDEQTLAKWCKIPEKMVRCWLDSCLMTEEELHMVQAILYLHQEIESKDAEIEILNHNMG